MFIRELIVACAYVLLVSMSSKIYRTYFATLVNDDLPHILTGDGEVLHGVVDHFLYGLLRAASLGSDSARSTEGTWADALRRLSIPRNCMRASKGSIARVVGQVKQARRRR